MSSKSCWRRFCAGRARRTNSRHRHLPGGGRRRADGAEKSVSKLIEALAEAAAQTVLNADGRVREVTVTLEKPGAVAHCSCVGVTIRRVAKS